MVPNTLAVWTAQSSRPMNVLLLWREMVKRRIRCLTASTARQGHHSSPTAYRHVARLGRYPQS
jgi:hypothetical protein